MTFTEAKGEKATMGFLLDFLNRNLKGYRLLVLIAFIMTAFEVLAALLPGTVIKAILDLVQFGHPKDPNDWTTIIINLFYHPAPGQPLNPATPILILITTLIVL